jgi:outer membrane protein assembly factor BamB
VKGTTDTGSQFPKVGPVVTASGLIFTGTRDKKIRAFDAETGKVLWTFETEAGIEGMPAIYQINGKEYLVYCAAANPSTHTHAPFYSATPGQAQRGGADDAEAGQAAGRGAGRAAATPAANDEGGAAPAVAGARGGGRAAGRGGRAGGGGNIGGAYIAFALPSAQGR